MPEILLLVSHIFILKTGELKLTYILTGLSVAEGNMLARYPDHTEEEIYRCRKNKKSKMSFIETKLFKVYAFGCLVYQC